MSHNIPTMSPTTAEAQRGAQPLPFEPTEEEIAQAEREEGFAE